ncbi:hypothetical protein EDEG_03988 [Edhazardia aedis USNM 41457]|uniref:Uncharacterized protein n=1 Tax=Edhazardia aedis (strain USNM 41457) TaxID=1003232 RepID=J9DJ16_EDHAE|nr:hypothetical protein EDEG_03988 [Edhazardia aedis USNM 41457]|eukprot:EJW01382.1 hypothetical protein EDEG_03988 [Edhazardia aedis USNM 41457]
MQIIDHMISSVSMSIKNKEKGGDMIKKIIMFAISHVKSKMKKKYALKKEIMSEDETDEFVAHVINTQLTSSCSLTILNLMVLRKKFQKYYFCIFQISLNYRENSKFRYD